MSYILRDRSDGQVEIIFSRPVLVGVFPERDVAQRICSFLSDDEIEPLDQQTSTPTTAPEELADNDTLMDEFADAPRQHRRKPEGGMLLPAIVERPRAAVSQKAAIVNHLSDDEIAGAFARITAGEKIHAVADDVGLTMGQLRSMWANHKRNMQKFMAADGQQACSHCAKAFTPSLTNPNTCARCSA